MRENKKTNIRKRVLALLLATMMVLSIVVPSGGASKVKANTNPDITGFIVQNGAILKLGTEVVEKNWSVNTYDSYNLELSFAEDFHDGGAQFDMDDDAAFTYYLPKGLIVKSYTNPLIIKLGDGREVNNVYNCTLDPDTGRYVIKGNFADDAYLRGEGSKNTKFYFQMNVSFSEDAGNTLDFGNGYTESITLDSSGKVNANKSISSYDLSNGLIYYTATVTSKGSNTNVNIFDDIRECVKVFL